MTKLEQKLIDLGYMKDFEKHKFFKMVKYNFLVITLSNDNTIIKTSIIETMVNIDIDEISKAVLKKDLEVLKQCQD